MQQVKWKFVLRFVVEIVLYLNHQLFEIQCVTVDVHVKENSKLCDRFTSGKSPALSFVTCCNY